VGRLIWQRAQSQRLLAAGPSSVVQALAAHWQTTPEATAAARVDAATGPVLVLAGSLSPMTALQVQAASSYQQVALDAGRLTSDADYAQQMSVQIAALLAQGRHVLAVTSPPGHAPGSAVDSRALAQASGELLARVLKAVPLRRLGIAGGDTSSHAVQALDAWGLSYAAQLAPGVALCRLHSDQASLDGMEIMLKGGQMGGADLFETLLHGIT
jgi:uncharacterized protein YgbK (DUF1537 family)